MEYYMRHWPARHHISQTGHLQKVHTQQYSASSSERSAVVPRTLLWSECAWYSWMPFSYPCGACCVKVMHELLQNIRIISNEMCVRISEFLCVKVELLLCLYIQSPGCEWGMNANWWETTATQLENVVNAAGCKVSNYSSAKDVLFSFIAHCH